MKRRMGGEKPEREAILTVTGTGKNKGTLEQRKSETKSSAGLLLESGVEENHLHTPSNGFNKMCSRKKGGGDSTAEALRCQNGNALWGALGEGRGLRRWGGGRIQGTRKTSLTVEKKGRNCEDGRGVVGGGT